MNIRVELEKELTKKQVNKITEYTCSTPNRFQKLMDCFFDSNHRMVLKASWVVIKSIPFHRAMLNPYISELVKQISKSKNQEHLIRNSLRILELIDFPEIYHGVVMNTCFEFIENPQTAIAIKAYSLTILYNLSCIYPEINDELKCIIEEKWDNETPAFKSRGKKILSQINRSRKLK